MTHFHNQVLAVLTDEPMTAYMICNKLYGMPGGGRKQVVAALYSMVQDGTILRTQRKMGYEYQRRRHVMVTK